MRGISTIDLYVAVGLIAHLRTQSEGIGTKPLLSQFQVQCSSDVARSLRVAIEARVQTDTLQVTTLHITGHGVHLVRAGIENLHAVDGRRETFRLHIIHGGLPGIRATAHQFHMVQFLQVLVDSSHLPFYRTFTALFV